MSTLRQFSLLSSRLTSLRRLFSSVKYPLQLGHIAANHSELYSESINNPERFWGDLGKTRLKWMKEFDNVMNCNIKRGEIRWFEGGVINVSGKNGSPFAVYVFCCCDNCTSCCLLCVYQALNIGS